MFAQAQSFQDLIKAIANNALLAQSADGFGFQGGDIELEVYGDGLLAHLLKTAADMVVEEMVNAS